MPRTVIANQHLFCRSGAAALMSLTATAAAWVMKPMKLKRSSPREASATPQEIISTITARRLLGSWIRNVQEMSNIATGTNACDRF